MSMENNDLATLKPKPKKQTVNRKKRVIVAGVGNMFMKDDGFGSAVIKKMFDKKYPEGVEIKDFGTGGLKLAYDLMKGYDGLVLLDASQRGGKPGTLYLIEPDEKEFSRDLEQGGPIDPHGSDPVSVLRFVKAIGAWPGKVLIVACEPANVEDFEIGLSDEVAASVDKAVALIDEIINDIYQPKKEKV